MFEEEFAKLYESEKEEFKRVCNYLLSKTFVLRDLYDKQNKRMITTATILFALGMVDSEKKENVKEIKKANTVTVKIHL